jgi:tetratricopeptide (TPR) repeat protein
VFCPACLQVEEEERLWTEVIDTYGKLDAEWVSDIVSRAWGNRGNARSRQGRMEEALGDFDHSIELAPYAADPVLNRGVVLESLGRYEEAASDYEAVLSAQPNDPAAWNNLGNVQAALRRWDEALVDYRRAVQLAPEFSFAAANYALALYQVGRENEAFKQFRSILRKYPEFPDVRAALAVSLYAQGLTAEAETNWLRMEDGRYRDRNWVRQTRRWPPRLVSELEAFLDLKSVVSS